MIPQNRDMTSQCKCCLEFFYSADLNQDKLCPRCARITASIKPPCPGLAEFVDEDSDDFNRG